METLYLHIKHGSGIHINAVMLFNISCKAHLVLVFNVHELLPAPGVFCIDCQAVNMRQIGDPVAADLFRNPISQKRISMKKEPSLGDAVGLVVEFFRHHLIEVL